MLLAALLLQCDGQLITTRVRALDVRTATAYLEMEEPLQLGTAGGFAQPFAAVVVAKSSPHRMLSGAVGVVAKPLV